VSWLYRSFNEGDDDKSGLKQNAELDVFILWIEEEEDGS